MFRKPSISLDERNNPYPLTIECWCSCRNSCHHHPRRLSMLKSL